MQQVLFMGFLYNEQRNTSHIEFTKNKLKHKNQGYQNHIIQT